MHVIRAVNVNDAYARAVQLLAHTGQHVMTRNGVALVANEPVTTRYERPMERVLWDEARDANPTFHLVEALWMLAGRDDAKLLAYLVPRMAQYAEPNTNYFHGAYGFRWRHFQAEDAPMAIAAEHGTMDQLDIIVKMLRDNPTDRRIVLQMWDAAVDLNAQTRDIPCNVMVKFMADPISPERYLNMVVFNRSNDIILGCYGANAVHMSVLQEYVAARAGMRVGWYEQVSCDWHAYVEQWSRVSSSGLLPDTPYMDGAVDVTPIVTHPGTFDRENSEVIAELTARHRLRPDSVRDYMNPIFYRVVMPMMDAYHFYRQGDLSTAIECIEEALLVTPRSDWLVNMAQWLNRRILRQRVRGADVEG